MGSSERSSKPPQDWKKLWDIFHQAREMDPAERINFLNGLEIPDQKFRSEVEDLLAAESNNGHSFENIVNDELTLLEQHGSAFQTSEIQADTLLAGRFLILQELGRGGMGTVYEALDQELGSKVALKTMQSELISDAAARERFYREINLARKVTHPNACRIFDLFQHGDLLFLTMELLPGETLQQKIKREGRMDLERTIDIVLQILETLSEMHRIGIVHRDLKTSNIILVPSDERYRAVVTDFGLAVGLSGSGSFEVTQTGQVLGTPQYMAPEQLKKETITPATDIYALGLVLYEMLTGELPLKGESPLTIAAKRISEDAPSPKLLLPTLDRKWERIILRCLERNPKDRFQSVADLMNTITGKSINTWIPFFVLRYRSRIAIGLLALLMSLVGIFYFWQTRKTIDQISSTDVISKRIWTGATGIPAGATSTDGKILIDIDWAKANVMAIDLKTKKKRSLTNSNTWFHPYDFINHPVDTLLSPDSKIVAYSIGTRTGAELRIVSTSGSAPRSLFRIDEAWITPLAWSSDGLLIAAHILQKDGSVDIGLLSTKHGMFRKLKTVDSSDIRKISFSQDSKYIAYDFPQAHESTNHDVFLISLETGLETRIVAHPSNDYLLGWSPDGKKLLFASDRSATNDAWSLRIVNGKPEGTAELIRKDIGQIYPLKITNDGSLYYAHMMSAVDVYMARLDGKSAPSRITQGDVGFSRSPAFSRDGNLLVFQSLSNPLSSRWTAATEPFQLKIISLQSQEVRKIAPEIQSAGGRTRLSADGQSIFMRGDNGKQEPGLYEVDLATGKSSKIVADRSTNWVRQYHVSPDGKSIFYLLNKDGSIIQKEIASGKEKIICDDAADFDLSFDGRFLVVMGTNIYKGTSSLRIIPIDGGNGNTIYKLPMPNWISAVAWLPDGKALIFSQGQRDLIDAPHRLWKISNTGGTPIDLGISSEYVFDLRVHPDGKQIAISTITDSSEVWVMENFLNRN